MKFNKWIEETDPKVIAKKLKVDPSTVSKWRSGIYTPTKANIKSIIKMSDGRVQLQDIIDHCFKIQ